MPRNQNGKYSTYILILMQNVENNLYSAVMIRGAEERIGPCESACQRKVINYLRLKKSDFSIFHVLPG